MEKVKMSLMLKIFPDIELIVSALVFAALFIQVLDVRGWG